MLIQRLAEYGTQAGTPPPYYRNRAVRWSIQLDASGRALTSELTDLADADNKAGPQMATPFTVRSGTRPPPMLLCDSLVYVLGMAQKDTEEARVDAARRHGEYVALLRAWLDAAPDDSSAAAVCSFFGRGDHRRLLIPPEAKPADPVTIMIGGQRAHMSSSAVSFWAGQVRARKTAGQAEGICLCCGMPGRLLGTIPDMIKGTLIPVGKDQAGRFKRGRDAALISVNQSAQGRSGIIQLASIPVCDGCGSAVMTALNALLDDPDHRRRGEDSVLAWWLRRPAAFSLDIIDKPVLKDVEAMLDQAQAARPGTVIDTNAFHALTLSANQSRVVVRDWLEAPLAEVKASLARWFADHRCTRLSADGIHPAPLWQMVQATGRWDGSRYVPGSAVHDLERHMLRCALRGLPPPASLAPRLLSRIRHDHRIDHPRVAMLRLILTRPPFKEQIMPGLDETTTDPPYVWGRIFATLESIQHRALPDLNATIRDRYFGLAMTQPAATMRTLRTNANGHIKKLLGRESTKGAGISLDRKLASVMALISHESGLPAHLDARGQIQFILGYDHQRAADMTAARAARAGQPAPGRHQDPQPTPEPSEQDIA